MVAVDGKTKKGDKVKELAKTLLCTLLALILIGSVCWAIWTVVLRHELKKPNQPVPLCKVHNQGTSATCLINGKNTLFIKY